MHSKANTTLPQEPFQLLMYFTHVCPSMLSLTHMNPCQIHLIDLLVLVLCL